MAADLSGPSPETRPQPNRNLPVTPEGYPDPGIGVPPPEGESGPGDDPDPESFPREGSPTRSGSIRIFHASAGAGHRAAAQAVREALSEAGCEAESLDVLDFAPPAFRRLYADLYMWCGERAHGLCRIFYRLTDHPRGSHLPLRLQERIERRSLASFLRAVPASGTGSALCTHFLPAALLGHLRREGLWRGRLSVCVTDFDLHGYWVVPEADRYFVAPGMTPRLVAAGIRADRIVETGIPVRSAYRPRAGGEGPGGIPGRDRPFRLLFSAGSIRPGRVEAILEAIAARTRGEGGPRLELELIRGRGTGDVRIPAALSGHPAIRVRAFGRIPDFPERMAGADLLLTKPGGLVCSEALAAGLPLLLTCPIPLQEIRNAEALQAAGCALHRTSPEAVAEALSDLIGDPDRLADLASRARALGRPDAARAVAEILLRERPAPEGTAGGKAPGRRSLPRPGAEGGRATPTGRTAR